MVNVLIESSYSLFGDWSTFGLVYSLRKFAPNVNIHLKYSRKAGGNQYFVWTRKMKVVVNKNIDKFVKFNSHILLIHPVDNEILQKLDNIADISGSEFCSEVKQDKFTPFVSFRDGCGNFVMSEWIDKDDCPFPYADYFMTETVSLNETEVIKLWKLMNQVYSYLLKGA
jgi:hypothetical protein